MDAIWLTTAIVLVLITYFGRALRWQVMIRPVAPQSRLWPLFEITMIGFCAAVLLGRAGEFVRPYLIAKKENVSFSSQAAIWFLERLTDLLAVLLIFGWALAAMNPTVAANVGPQIRWVLEWGGRASLLIGGLSLVLLLAFRQFPDLAQTRIAAAAEALPERFRGRIVPLIESFASGMASTRDGAALTLILIYSVLEWLLIVACYYCILRSFPPTAALTVRDTFIVMGFISFGSMVQIPGVGGGMQVVAILVLREMYGLGLEDATASAMVLWAIGLATVVPPGLILAGRYGLSWRNVKDMPR